MTASMYGNYFVEGFRKPDCGVAATCVDERPGANEALIHSSNGSYVPFLVYRGADSHYLLDSGPAPHHPPQVCETVGDQIVGEADLATWRANWLVVAINHSIPNQEAVLAHLEGTSPLLHQNEIDSIVLRHYDIGAK